MAITIDPKKLLTEEGWKDVAPDCKGKDKELLKALGAYGDLEDDDFDGRSKALARVAALAGTLKTAKEVAIDPDAIKYLAAMVNAAKAKQAELLKAKAEAGKKADAAAKKHEEPEGQSDEEGEDETTDSCTKLKRAIQSLKTAKMPYYFLVCDAKPYGLVISKKDIRNSAQAKKELAQIAGGSTRPPKFGECRFDSGKLVFEMEKPVTGLARILQKWIKECTGLGLKVMVGTESGDDEEAQSGAAGAGGDPMRMRKQPPIDLTLHNLPGADDAKDGGAAGASQGAGAPVGSGKTDGKDKDGSQAANGSRDPDQVDRENREKQQQDAKQPAADKMAAAAKDLLFHYASENLAPLKEKALNDLARAWREAPGGVIAASAILGAAGVTYLIKTGTNLPKIPSIPLDFLAGRAPVFKGAELNLEVNGPITSPSSFKVSITFHEQAGGQGQTKSRPGRGKVFTPRMVLRQDGVKAGGEEPGADLDIEGQVPIPSDAGAEDAAATIAAIEDANVEVEVSGTPVYSVRVLSVTDNYHPGPYGLGAPPTNRALTVRLHTTVPPIFHQGKDEVAERPVRVRINRVGSDGEANIRVHLEPLPTQAAPGTGP